MFPRRVVAGEPVSLGGCVGHFTSSDGRLEFVKELFCIDSWNGSRWEGLSNTSHSKAGGSRSRRCTSEYRNGDVNLHQRDQYHWTGLISKHAKNGQGRQALRVYREMQESGVKPTSYTFVAALKACSSLQDLRTARQLHFDVVKCGFESDLYVGTMLVDTYVKCGSLVDARRIFDKMPRRDVVSWTAMIVGYAQREQGELALQLYARMQQEKILPNDRTFVGALKACSSLASLEDGKQGDGRLVKGKYLEHVRSIHSQVLMSGTGSDVFVGTMLVDAYSKCGSPGDARSVFEQMPSRTVASWNAMILGLTHVGDGEEALQLYARMQREGVVPNDRTFVGALKACSCLTELQEGDQQVDTTVQTRCLEQVRAIHADVLKREFASDVFVGTMLVDVYAKCGSLVDARRVFENMPSHDVTAWTALMSGYVQMEQGEAALQLYAKMQQEGVVPDVRSFVTALKACGSLAGFDKGKEIHAQLSRLRLDTFDLFVASALIDMYSKCGSMDDAQKTFETLRSRDMVTWNALIAGYARQGESDMVFSLVDGMRQEGKVPNSITFLSILTVCSHAGLVERGQKYFDAMINEYGISPTMEHYNCMVDILGRAGELNRAMEIAEKMPYEPSGALWRCVLGACRKWKSVELGRQAFEYAVKADKNDSSIYVLMSNIYAAARMHEEAKEIQAMRVEAGAWKKPGQSWWTDLTGVVHGFSVGTGEHPESRHILAKVHDLFVKMKKHGYVPHLESVLRDIPDDEKEDALCGHSEKMAIACALLNTPEGTTIRVVKNLRACEDCHTATALISKIERRTIICRDASRFHVYKDGECSCGGYW